MPEPRPRQLDPFGSSRPGASAPLVVRVAGDLTIPTAAHLHDQLRAAIRRRGARTVVVDFAGAGRFDSAGIAVITLATRRLARTGRTLELTNLEPHHTAALALVPEAAPAVAAEDDVGWVEGLGAHLLDLRTSARELGTLLAETARQIAAVVIRRKRMPAGAFVHQAVVMGAEALFIVGLLAGLIGMTLAFLGAVQLARFGAGIYVADMVGVGVVREFAPMMTAIILAGRAGAAIAAELGTMRAGAEIDALQAMGVSPVRFLVLPRLAALSVMQPALTLLAMFIGVGGGMLVGALVLDVSPAVFAARVVARVELSDILHGLGKSLVFAWIIAVTGTFLGLQSSGNASAVGAATTRTVVVCVSLILLVDALVATVTALGGP